MIGSDGIERKYKNFADNSQELRENMDFISTMEQMPSVDPPNTGGCGRITAAGYTAFINGRRHEYCYDPDSSDFIEYFI